MAEEVSRHLAFFNWAEEDTERRRQGMPAANFHSQRVLSVRKTCILGGREGGRIVRRRFQTQLTSADKNAATTNAREENGENWARGFQRWNSLCCRWDHVTRSSGREHQAPRPSIVLPPAWGALAVFGSALPALPSRLEVDGVQGDVYTRATGK